MVFRRTETLKPFRYRPKRYTRGRYAQTWVVREIDPGGDSAFPKRAFSVWAGENPLTEARMRNLALVKQRLGVEHVLVTPANLEDWLVEGHPLHPAYPALSMIHRSDYLRGYLMHHHGGGYLDIKEPLNSWATSFEAMVSDPDCWVTSYRTTDANWVGKLRGPMGRDILVRYGQMFGKSGFLMRSHTPMTAEWMAEMDRRLDAFSEELGDTPPSDPFGGPSYPISWNDLLARVLDPLTLKHLSHVRLDERLLLRFEAYR